MMDPIVELKVRAERMQKQQAAAAKALVMRRKHCLAAVAQEHGFPSWSHALRAMNGDPGETELGTLLYDPRSGAFLHPWFSVYDEARTAFDAQAARGRPYLLAFRRQFFLAERTFVATLGFDPDDADWRAIGWDWARPLDATARRRLYGKRLAALRGDR
jgi:hypothetical protein